MARKRSRSRPGKKRTRSRTRTIVKYRTRRAGKAMRRTFRRRSSGGGGLPFRTGGSLVSRVTGSVVPVTKVVVPIVVGAVGGAVLAKAIAAKVKNSPVKTGLGVTAAAILLGSFAGKAGKGLARTVAFAAVGMAADGVMRVLAPARASGKVPLLPRGNAGLLAGTDGGVGDEAELAMEFVPSN